LSLGLSKNLEFLVFRMTIMSSDAPVTYPLQLDRLN
jgi:hypothetical protein